jgi:hypothetical protein
MSPSGRHPVAAPGFSKVQTDRSRIRVIKRKIRILGRPKHALQLILGNISTHFFLFPPSSGGFARRWRRRLGVPTPAAAGGQGTLTPNIGRAIGRTRESVIMSLPWLLWLPHFGRGMSSVDRTTASPH